MRVSQQYQLLSRFHTLGQHGNIKVFAEPYDGAEDSLRCFMPILQRAHSCGEKTVYFYFVKWEIYQVAERRVANVKIINGNTDPAISNGMQATKAVHVCRASRRFR